MTRNRLFLVFFALGAALVAFFALFPSQIPMSEVVTQRISGKFTVSDRVNQFGPTVAARWKPFFERAGVEYPPKKLILVAFKAEKQLEIYAGDDGNTWKKLRAMPIVRASGKIGPKLREGDLQVPEGVYEVESLNSNSAFHLALRVGYPSPSDRAIARREGRDLDGLGGNIMIHGGAASIGCLAMGDEAAEDLFVLTALVGRENVEIWICPLDFRVSKAPFDAERKEWVEERYAQLSKRLAKLP